jgi:hypothetical protein
VGVASAPQTVTVTNSGTAELTFSSIAVSSGFSQTNNCGTGIAASGGCTISVTFTPTAPGTVAGTLTITDNASGSPQTVALSGTGNPVSVSPNTLGFWDVAVGTTSTPQSVTLNNAAATAVAITITISGDFAISNNTCGTSVAAGGNCTISVTFTPEGSGPWTGTLTIVDAVGTQTVALTGSNSFANTVPVTVTFGLAGNKGAPTATTSSYYNAIFTTVTVCEPGSTTNCATIPNVLVDTGSVGLRVLSNQLASVTLPPVNDPLTGYPFYECVQYGDLSYSWGPMEWATVQVGGETASQVPAASGGTANAGIPIQVIAAGADAPSEVLSGTGVIENPCLVNPATGGLTPGFSDNSAANLGANGLLGIGVFLEDCGINCTQEGNPADIAVYPYMIDESGTYALEYAPLADQAWNPVATFSSTDTNGVVLQLPAIPAAGQETVPATGQTATLTFGINTESNNQIPGTATVYQLDENGFFGSSTFGGVTYTSTNSGGTFLDSGSEALFVSDASTLSSVLDTTVSDCTVGSTDIGFYCPSSTLSIPLEVAGTTGTSTTVTLSIANALSLFSANDYEYAAFNNLGIDSCTTTPCSPSTDTWDLGLPFFFTGNPIFFGIEGTSVGGVTSTNGYYAF